MPESNLLGERGRGYAQFLATLDDGRVAIAALAVGCIQACLDMSLQYAGERQTFGVPDRAQAGRRLPDRRPRGDAARLAAADLQARRSRTMRRPGAVDREFKQAAAVAKLYTTESAVTATRIATQVFGGYGFMEEYPVARFYRDAKVLEIGEGTSEVQRMLIARGLGLPAGRREPVTGSWNRTRVLAIIQAGGAGGRMDVLTRERAKPALPFAGVYQLVDFPLSNLAHSGVTDVWLSLQFRARRSRSPWPTAGPGTSTGPRRPAAADARAGHRQPRRGGLRARATPTGCSGSARRSPRRPGRGRRAQRRPRLPARLHAVVDTHLAPGAECTIVTTEVPSRRPATTRSSRSRRRPGHRVRLQARGPEDGHDRAEVIVYDPAVLVEVLEELHRELARPSSDAGDTGLGDFGDHLVPRLVERGRTSPGRWTATGATSASRTTTCRPTGRAHRRPRHPRRAGLADPHPAAAARAGPGARGRPGRGQPAQPRLARRGHGGAQRDGARRGRRGRRRGPRQRRLRRQRGAGRGPGALVRGRLRLRGRADARVGDPEADGTGDPDAVTLVGQGSVVGAGVVLAAGARLEPGTTA